VEIKDMIVKQVQYLNFIETRKHLESILEFPRFEVLEEQQIWMSNHYTHQSDQITIEVWNTSKIQWIHQKRDLFQRDYKMPIKYYSSMMLSRRISPDATNRICTVIWESYRDPALLTEFILIPKCIGCGQTMFSYIKEDGKSEIYSFWHDCNGNGLLKNHLGDIQHQ